MFFMDSMKLSFSCYCFLTANDGGKALGSVNQAATPAAVKELNNEPILKERTPHDRNEMDECKTLNEPKEKIKRDACKGSENSAHTINRNEKEMKEARSRSFVSSEGIYFYVSSVFSVRLNFKSPFTFSSTALHYSSRTL